MAAKKRAFRIVYEDKDIIVTNKAAGLLAVPIPGSKAINLFDLITDYAGKRGGRVRSVHRIDRYTSGLMVFTKNEQSYQHLLNQFKNHTPERCYLALIRGIPEKDQGELKHHLKLTKKGFRNVVVDPGVKGAAQARLTYEVKERFLNTALIEAYLDTGLKNQIRVQFEAEGHQLVGDQHYASEEKNERLINRQALHAFRLSFNHPGTNQQVTYMAKIPPDMLRLIDHYRWRKEMMGKQKE